MESSYILEQANKLAHDFYSRLSGHSDETITFWSAEDEMLSVCWDMAVIAYKELKQVDPNEHKPKDVIDPRSLYLKFRDKASSDGRPTEYG